MRAARTLERRLGVAWAHRRHRTSQGLDTLSKASNWELLCLYCHENEHSRNAVASAYGERADADAPASSHNQPFADVDKLLKKPQ